MLVPRFEFRSINGYSSWGIVDYENNKWFPYGPNHEWDKPVIEKRYDPIWWEEMRHTFAGPSIDETNLIKQGPYLYPHDTEPDLNLAPWDQDVI